MRRIRHDRFVGVTLKTGLKSGTSDVCRIDWYSMLEYLPAVECLAAMIEAWEYVSNTFVCRQTGSRTTADGLQSSCCIYTCWLLCDCCCFCEQINQFISPTNPPN